MDVENPSEQPPLEEVRPDAYQVRLDIFEGPLDLLLHLIRTQEIDIYDIPIARITDQYLHYLQMMRNLNMTVAGDYLVMAATLIYIKSRMLLPASPAEGEDQELEDPRRELVEQLLEYEKFKKAAHFLYQQETVELSVWGRGSSEFEEDEKEAVVANVFDLIQAFHQIVERFKDQIIMEVPREEITLEMKIEEIRRLLLLQSEILFSSFFRRKISRLHLVLTIFALLEMVRLQEVRLQQEGLFEDIRIVAC